MQVRGTPKVKRYSRSGKNVLNSAQWPKTKSALGSSSRSISLPRRRFVQRVKPIGMCLRGVADGCNGFEHRLAI